MKLLTAKQFLALDFRPAHCEVTDYEHDDSWLVGHITLLSEPDIELTFSWQALSHVSAGVITKKYKVNIDEYDPNYSLEQVALVNKNNAPLKEKKQAEVFEKLLQKTSWKSMVQTYIQRGGESEE
jgi:2,3-bisphosphoglycerate-independent phosphoglycerate mutase